jgi:hypothetical protein
MNKKKTVWTVALVIVMCVGALGYYAYLTERNVQRQAEEKLTETDELLLMDLENDYPYAPRDVVKLYSRMITCVYNERLADDELGDMVKQMRRLYSDELCEEPENSESNQIQSLTDEMKDYGDNDHKITNTTVCESSQVDYGEVDGQQTAMVDVVYTVRYDNNYVQQPQVFVLVQDKEEHWKILGWQDSQGDIQSSATTEEE